MVAELEVEPAVLRCFHVLFTGKKASQEGRAAHHDGTCLPENTDLRVESHWRIKNWGDQYCGNPSSQKKEAKDGLQGRWLQGHSNHHSPTLYSLHLI